MTEDELLTAVTDAMTLFGWRWMHPRRSDKALTMGHQGFPDIVAVRPPRILFVELKAQKGQTSEEQKTWIARLSATPVEVEVLRPDRLDEFLDYLR